MYDPGVVGIPSTAQTVPVGIPASVQLERPREPPTLLMGSLSPKLFSDIFDFQEFKSGDCISQWESVIGDSAK